MKSVEIKTGKPELHRVKFAEFLCAWHKNLMKHLKLLKSILKI